MDLTAKEGVEYIGVGVSGHPALCVEEWMAAPLHPPRHVAGAG